MSWEKDRQLVREFLDAVRETHPGEIDRLYAWFVLQMEEINATNRAILQRAQIENEKQNKQKGQQVK